MSKRDEAKLRVYNGKYVKTLRLPCTSAMKEFILAQNNISKSMYYLIVDYLRRRGCPQRFPVVLRLQAPSSPPDPTHVPR